MESSHFLYQLDDLELLCVSSEHSSAPCEFFWLLIQLTHQAVALHSSCQCTQGTHYLSLGHTASSYSLRIKWRRVKRNHGNQLPFIEQREGSLFSRNVRAIV